MNKKLIFQVAATYIGAVMGAGFASGQEIQQFFISFGKKGLLGIGTSALLFAIFGYIMLDLQKSWQVSSYTEFFQALIGKKWGSKIDILISILLFIGMMAMLSGTGAVFQQYLDLSPWIGTLLTAVVIALALWYKGEGVLWINSALIPIKFIFCFGIALLAILFMEGTKNISVDNIANPLVGHYLFSSILYVSFNLTIAMVVFASLGKDVQKSEGLFGAALGGLGLGLFASIIGLSLLKFPEVQNYEIPMVVVAGKLGSWWAFFYVVVLWLAMLTAAIGNGFSLVSHFEKKYNMNYRKVALILLIIVIPLAGIKFSLIVKIVYPLFGYLGLIFLPFLLLNWIKNRILLPK
ncbi:MAG: hypothetical protein GX958_03960 [Desulfitobacterium sp.]|nr:hypothetical protein [Desulfitobacterium sp.]